LPLAYKAPTQGTKRYFQEIVFASIQISYHRLCYTNMAIPRTPPRKVPKPMFFEVLSFYSFLTISKAANDWLNSDFEKTNYGSLVIGNSCFSIAC